MKCLFEGAGVAIVTPFKNGGIDFVAFKRLIERDMSLGAKAIIVLGTTGESATISEKEREKIVRLARKCVKGDVKLIVGTGSNNFEVCQKYTLQAKHLGADGALVVTPYYNKTSQQGLFEFYDKLSQIGLPIIMYNVPSRTGLCIDLDTVSELSENEMIYGIKESTSDIKRIIQLANICKDKIALYSGEDNLNYVFYTLGASGCISVTANVLPHKVQAVYDAVKEGDCRSALEVQNDLDETNNALFCEVNPVPVKAMLAQMGFIQNAVRMPLVLLNEEHEKLIATLAEKIKADC